jgi:hypothetical protein
MLNISTLQFQSSKFNHDIHIWPMNKMLTTTKEIIMYELCDCTQTFRIMWLCVSNSKQWVAACS